MSRAIQLLTEDFADRPAFDTAVSHALMRRVARGENNETLRLSIPGRMVAFGRQDTVATGYRQAVAAARAGGFVPVERLAGGRAAVFTEDTIAFSWAIPTADARAGITQRFEDLATIMAAAFGRLGLDARVGEVAGEYCPGTYSVNLEGSRKVMGVGQRLIRGAAHIGGVVVVAGANVINAILDPVYAAMEFEWKPAATGALADSVPGLFNSDVIDALVAEFGERYELVPATVDAATLALAEELAPEHHPASECLS